MSLNRDQINSIAHLARLSLTDAEVPVCEELRHVAERHLGPITDRRHSLGDAGSLETLLRDAGFQDIRTRTLSRTIRFEDGSVFIRLNTMALVGMSGASKEMGDQEREGVVMAILRDSAPVLQANTDERGFSFQLSTNLATARG